jgi:hypothetical protein
MMSLRTRESAGFENLTRSVLRLERAREQAQLKIRHPPSLLYPAQEGKLVGVLTSAAPDY